MKDPILIERMGAGYIGFMHHEHKDHYPLRFFVNRYLMVQKRSKRWRSNDQHTFYFVREIRRLEP